MCLAAPAKVISIDKSTALVEFGGAKMNISIRMVPTVKVGDYVMVHAGYAINVIDEEEAFEELELWKELKNQVNES